MNIRKAAGLAALALGLGSPPAAWAATWLPGGAQFEAPLADQRWPGFYGIREGGLGAAGPRNLALAGLGGLFNVLGGELGGGDWRFGLQPGIFTLWDMGTESWDFVNADFLMALPWSWRRGRFSALARVCHVSSHLGDEFILHNGVERLNLSYEEVGALAGWTLFGVLRLYGGGGYLYRRFPIEMRPWRTQAGLDYAHGSAYWRGRLRPVASVDLQQRQEHGWGRVSLSFRGGIQLENPALAGRRLRLLADYYRGRDPNGQFYTRSVERLGAGVFLAF
ncbi:MAG: DUF1207 domain-containing protein [Elusimicrobia bacterium]|nr:DUF1207 domain-containing protein [Elusimicrobiota bacterium]